MGYDVVRSSFALQLMNSENFIVVANTPGDVCHVESAHKHREHMTSVKHSIELWLTFVKVTEKLYVVF